jgi:S1-C subfamily serine protease
MTPRDRLLKTLAHQEPDRVPIDMGSSSTSIDGSQYLIGGDIIVSVNNTKVITQDALSAYLERHVTAGQSIKVGIIRAGNQLTVTLTVGAIPSS